MRALLAAWLIVFALVALAVTQVGSAPSKSLGPVVKILTDDGHGSGSHIGNKVILTAAHVVGDAKTVTIKTDDGNTRPASVLWSNREYDIALVLLERADDIATAPLACREPSPGEAITASGSPGNIEFVTTYGRVAGKARPVGALKSAVVFDGTVAPGMSGGPIMDAQGRVVGVTVALMVVPMGFSGSLIPVSYFVPASAVCLLMGR